MFFPASLNAANKSDAVPQEIHLHGGNNTIHVTKSFKYLGVILSFCLTKDTETKARIKKASSQMGNLKHFFYCKDLEM